MSVQMLAVKTYQSVYPRLLGTRNNSSVVGVGHNHARIPDLVLCHVYQIENPKSTQTLYIRQRCLFVFATKACNNFIKHIFAGYQLHHCAKRNCEKFSACSQGRVSQGKKYA